MNNKKYIRILAEMAIVLSAAGIMTGCVNKRAEDVSSSQADIVVTTDDETTIDETTTDEIFADSSSNIESSNSQNESSLKEDSVKLDSKADDVSSKICNCSEVQKIEQTEVAYTETNSNQTYFEPEIINETQPELDAPIIESEPVIVEESSTELGEPVTDAVYDPYDLYNQGRLYYGDYQYTWYSERVLPGYGLVIDGRHTDADGFVCDGDGYICVAASSLNKGTVVDTPFGRQGKVYDSGCDWGVIDVYVNW